MKKYWFVLYPETFLWVKGEKGLVYNALNGVKILFDLIGKRREIVDTLLQVDNLYRVLLTETILQESEIGEWIREMVDKGCGRLVPDDGMTKRPVSLKPILKVQDDTDYYRWEHKQEIDGNILHNLHHLICFVNGSEHGNDLYSRQTIYPVADRQQLDLEKLYQFIKDARYSPFLSEISLVGNLLGMAELPDFIGRVQSIAPVTIYLEETDFAKGVSQLEKLPLDVEIHVLICNCSATRNMPQTTGEQNINYTFLITSEQEYETVSDWIEKAAWTKTAIVPVYTGKNLSFFEEFMYLDQTEIDSMVLSKKDVFLRQTLNVFHFGQLYILPDGKVYANRNDVSLGHIDESPYSLVYREMTERHSWLQVRDKKPCCDCVYQWLCPSPSNYEAVIGKANLCHINN